MNEKAPVAPTRLTPLTKQPPLTPAKPAAAVAPGRPTAAPSRFPFATIASNTLTTRFTAFIYGFSGSGKTYLARTVLEDIRMYPALVCICDRGDLTLRDIVDDEKLVVTNTRSFGDFNPIFEYLKSRNNVFKTVIVDNLSELHRSGLIDQAKRSSQNKDSRTGHEFTQQDYGVVRNQLLGLVSNFALELNINVIFTALASSSVDQITGVTSIEPNLSGKLAHEVPGYCDVVGYLSVKTPTLREQKEGRVEPVRTLQVTQSSNVQTARNRGGKLGQEMQNPTLSRIFSAMVGSSQSTQPQV